MNSDELYHYGVKGMRWGVRKKPTNWSSDAKEAESIKKKKLNEMSNDELNKLNRRQQLEQQHKQLNPSNIAKGILIAGAVAAALGTITKLYKNSKETAKVGKEISDKYKATQLKKKHAAMIRDLGEQAVLKRKNMKVSKAILAPKKPIKINADSVFRGIKR